VGPSADDPEYADIAGTSEPPQHRMREPRRFLEDDEALENEKVRVREPRGREEALEVLRASIRLCDRDRVRLGGAALPGRHRRARRGT